MNTNDLQLVGLTEDQRMAASDAARRRAIQELGPQPTPAAFEHAEAAAYPAWLTRLIAAMLGAAFVGAFALSMFNVFSAGRNHAADVLPGEAWQAAISGAAVVLLSEFLTITSVLTMQILLARQRRRWFMLLPAGLGVALALTANATIARPVTFWEHLVTVAPPVGVLFLAFILEAVALDAIRRHHAAARAYRAALVEWQQASREVDQSAAYDRQYAVALWETLTAVNRRGRGGQDRAAALADLTAAERRQLVRAEITAAAWWAADGQEAQAVRPFGGPSPAALELPAPVVTMASGNGHQNGKR